MTFTYPAVFTPHKDDKGFHAYFPDLECCVADGPDLEDAVENAREAARDWITVELEDACDIPPSSCRIMTDTVLPLPTGYQTVFLRS